MVNAISRIFDMKKDSNDHLVLSTYDVRISKDDLIILADSPAILWGSERAIMYSNILKEYRVFVFMDDEHNDLLEDFKWDVLYRNIRTSKLSSLSYKKPK